jgi:hypothetical protein
LAELSVRFEGEGRKGGNTIATSGELRNEHHELKGALSCFASRISRVEEGHSRTIEPPIKQEPETKEAKAVTDEQKKQLIDVNEADAVGVPTWNLRIHVERKPDSESLALFHGRR